MLDWERRDRNQLANFWSRVSNLYSCRREAWVSSQTGSCCCRLSASDRLSAADRLLAADRLSATDRHVLFCSRFFQLFPCSQEGYTAQGYEPWLLQVCRYCNASACLLIATYVPSDKGLKLPTHPPSSNFSSYLLFAICYFAICYLLFARLLFARLLFARLLFARLQFARLFFARWLLLDCYLLDCYLLDCYLLD